MKKTFFAIAIGMGAMAATPAMAQQSGAELVGQTVDIRFADGSTNSVTFDRSGRAIIRTTDGYTAGANWYARNGNLCLQSASATECWGYANRFAAGQTVSLTSDCGSATQWTARAVNAPPPPPAPVAAPVEQGERG